MKVNPLRLALLCSFLVIGLNGLFALYFMADPLGLSPVLDARENLAWAERIAAGDLPDEPFYRALLYPAVLAILAKTGLLSGAAATAFGVICHLFNAWLTGLISRRIWNSDGACWLSGLLYAVYPVAMWFSVQALDISFAITLFLVAVWLLLQGCAVGAGRRMRCGRLLLAGLFGGLAVLARPNFLPAAVLLPVLPVLLLWRERSWKIRVPCNAVLATATGLLGILLLQGAVNFRLSGAFKVMPWQGAYNLYAGNHSEANGKYLVQRVSFSEIPEGMNPTRMESEHLYRAAVGEDADPGIDAMNAFWRARLLEDIREAPAQWLGLMGRKLLYLLNDWEQYNNLSYAYQKERFVFLRFSPLSWGVLLLGAFAGLVVGWQRMRRREAGALALLFLAYAAGLLLFFVSARFRLPLSPLLCVFCGGLGHASPAGLRALGGGKGAVACLGGAVIAVLSFGNWFEARDRSPFIQDELLLATASQQVGEDRMALNYANSVLARDADSDEARRIQVSALFNLWLEAEDGRGRAVVWPRLVAAQAEVARPDASTFFIRGVVAWRADDATRAVKVWAEGLERFGPAAGSCALALQAVGARSTSDVKSQEIDTVRRILDR